ncbi:MAG: two-component regulator propeller domain-containing protein, partial [Verrucomicrobiota bacterium]
MKPIFKNLGRFSLLVFCFFPLSALAALLDYGARVWQTDDGLPQNHVQSILQTRDRYIWVGTQKGLARFDGVRFTIFTPENTPALKGRSITTLCESGDGTLWIGTSDGGLTRLYEGKFSHFGRSEGLGSDYVRILYETKDRVLWIGTREGLYQLKRGFLSSVQ